MECPQCHAYVAEDARFCQSCGMRLARSDGESLPPEEARPGPEGERRQLTVLFCDLVGSTELAGRLDPEEWRDVVERYQEAGARAVTRRGGHVAQYLGDGLLVYFGWPQTHDDAAERAVRAGLAMVDAVISLGRRMHTALRVRVGMHTGPVVISEEGAIFGDTPNIAARVQAMAEPGTVVVTAATLRLISGLFLVEEYGTRELRGVRQPVRLYRVLRPSGVRNRLAAAAAGVGLTPFIGREDERRILRTRFERVREGEGQVVLLVGEAGIGKSRQAQMLREDLAGAPHTWLESGGQPYFADTPLYTVTELLKQFFAWRAEDAPDDRLAALERALEAARLDTQRAIPLVAPLLGLPVPRDYPPMLAAPEAARRRLLATLAAWVLAATRPRPLVVLVEDLQWVDPSTLELLKLLVDQGATAPLLLLLTARPDFRAPWSLRAHHTQLTLTRLPRREVRELVARVAARAALPAAVVEAVVGRTDGVPLFVEELTKTMVEAGGSLATDIPMTLADSLMARLDRLGPEAKEVAQVGAVLGREFSYGLLRSVHPLPDVELETALGRLVDAELFYVQGLPPESVYLFKHRLVQDAAYGSLLKARRRTLHGRVAKMLAEQHPEVAEEQPELLAHHHTEANEQEAAIAAWERAGQRALARGAHGEAAGHLRRGLAVVGTLPEGIERDRREFGLQLPLGQALHITKSWGSPEAAEAFRRALALGEGLGEPVQVVLLLMGLWASAINREGPIAAQPLADQALAVAERAGIASLQVWGHFAQAATRHSAGDPAAAREHARSALSLYDEATALAVPIDQRVATLPYAALAAWMVGLPDEARALAREAVELAERVRRPADRAWAEYLAAHLHALLREPVAARAHAERALAACAEEPNPLFEAIATTVRGWALVAEDPAADGLLALREGIDRLVATGQRLSLEFFLGLLADAQARMGEVAAALATLDEAEEASPGEEVWRADTLRRRAELLVRAGAAPSAVEGVFRDAMGLARRQGARAFELRAASACARFLRDLGRAAEGRELLASVSSSFPEGLDTPELRDARALIEELA